MARDAAAPDPHENVIEALRIGRLIRTRETETREEIETGKVEGIPVERSLARIRKIAGL